MIVCGYMPSQLLIKSITKLLGARNNKCECMHDNAIKVLKKRLNIIEYFLPCLTKMVLIIL